MKKNLLIIGCVLAMVTHGQAQNYYTQIVKLKDGTEQRIIVDRMSQVNVLDAKQSVSQLTVTEYLKFVAEGTSDFASLLQKYGNTELTSPWLFPDWNNEYRQNGKVYVPQNAAWNQTVASVAPYFNYIPNMSMAYIRKDSYSGQVTNFRYTFDADLLKDRQTAITIIDQAAAGTVVSSEQVMNGEVNIVADVPLADWVKTLSLSGSDFMNKTSIFVSAGSANLWSTKNGDVQYVKCEPNSSFSKPEFNVILPFPLSTRYKFYCVMVPENPAFVNEIEADAAVMPYRFIATLDYCGTDGNRLNHVFLDETQDTQAFMDKYNIKDNASNHNTIWAFENDPSQIETIYLGEFTFPVAYEGINSETGSGPMLTISSPYSVFNAKLKNDYTRALRIAAIIMEPVSNE